MNRPLLFVRSFVVSGARSCSGVVDVAVVEGQGRERRRGGGRVRRLFCFFEKRSRSRSRSRLMRWGKKEKRIRFFCNEVERDFCCAFSREKPRDSSMLLRGEKKENWSKVRAGRGRTNRSASAIVFLIGRTCFFFCCCFFLFSSALCSLLTRRSRWTERATERASEREEAEERERESSAASLEEDRKERKMACLSSSAASSITMRVSPPSILRKNHFAVAASVDASWPLLLFTSFFETSVAAFKRTSSSSHSNDAPERGQKKRGKKKKKQQKEEEGKKNLNLHHLKTKMDFAGAADRLRREQAAAAQRARDKAACERAEASRAAAARERTEEDKRQRRLAQLREDEEARLREEAALEASKGVSWSSETPLAASAIDPSRSAAARGIRRGSKDKAMLPRGAGASLLAQNSRVNGAPAFELVAVGPAEPEGAEGGGGGLFPRQARRRRTHVGVLDYGCEDGRVALPPAVAERLWPWAKGIVASSVARDGGSDDGDDVEEEVEKDQTTTTATAAQTALPLALAGTGVPPGARVVATYRALPKGTFARLQPLEAGFQQAAGESVRELLEAALSGYCCLTEGDAVEVHIEDITFVLRVQALLPAEAVSVVETDLEVEVEPSEETAQRLRAEEKAREAAKSRALEAAARLSESKKAQEEAAEIAARATEAERAARDARRRELAGSLPAEPGAPRGGSGRSATPSVVAFRLRTPDGRSASRRFDASSTRVSVLFDWADSLEGGGAGVERGSYDLIVAGGGGAALAPPPQNEDDGGENSATAKTLAEAGFDRGGFALLVRPRFAP